MFGRTFGRQIFYQLDVSSTCCLCNWRSIDEIVVHFIRPANKLTKPTSECTIIEISRPGNTASYSCWRMPQEFGEMRRSDSFVCEFLHTFASLCSMDIIVPVFYPRVVLLRLGAAQAQFVRWISLIRSYPKSVKVSITVLSWLISVQNFLPKALVPQGLLKSTEKSVTFSALKVVPFASVGMIVTRAESFAISRRVHFCTQEFVYGLIRPFTSCLVTRPSLAELKYTQTSV